jgi:aryl-alcohol dehydrogenase-like predicted oxidoreductase
MEYRNLGSAGVKVSCLCLGTMNFGAATDEAASAAIIDRALDAGINFIDTADIYGKGASEEICGRAIQANGKRDEIVLATKFCGQMSDAVNDGGASRYHIVRACEASLKRLKTDRIDLYQVHFMNLSTPVEEIVAALDMLVRQGKVLYLGTSKWAPALLAEAITLAKCSGRTPFVCEQAPYNLCDRTIENELIWTCQRHGVGLIIWAPIASGILSGRYRKGQPIPADTRQGRSGVGATRFTEAAIDRVELLAPLAEARGVSLAEFCTAWVRDQPGVTAPIVGPRTVEHLDAAVASLEITLTAEEHEQIAAIAPPGQAVSNYYDSNAFGPLRKAIGVSR